MKEKGQRRQKVESGGLSYQLLAYFDEIKRSKSKLIFSRCCPLTWGQHLLKINFDILIFLGILISITFLNIEFLRSMLSWNSLSSMFYIKIRVKHWFFVQGSAGRTCRLKKISLTFPPVLKLQDFFNWNQS